MKIGGKYHYHTYRVFEGKKEEYIRNIIVDKIYSNTTVGFKGKGLVNKKHLKKGWHKDGENR